MMIVSLWNLTGISASLLPRCLSNVRAMGNEWVWISQLRVFLRSYCRTPARSVNRGLGSRSNIIRNSNLLFLHGERMVCFFKPFPVLFQFHIASFYFKYVQFNNYGCYQCFQMSTQCRMCWTCSYFDAVNAHELTLKKYQYVFILN